MRALFQKKKKEFQKSGVAHWSPTDAGVKGSSRLAE